MLPESFWQSLKPDVEIVPLDECKLIELMEITQGQSR
jgi:hypothetical protein